MGRGEGFTRNVYFFVVRENWFFNLFPEGWGLWLPSCLSVIFFSKKKIDRVLLSRFDSSRRTGVTRFCAGERFIMLGWILLSERGKFISVSKETWFASDFLFFIGFDLFLPSMILFLSNSLPSLISYYLSLLLGIVGCCKMVWFINVITVLFLDSLILM